MHATTRSSWILVAIAIAVVTAPLLLGSGGAEMSDVDGDGIADLSIYRTNGQWEVRESTGFYASKLTKTLGGAGYTAQSGDMDGDGLRDFVVYRESTGDWRALLSSTGYATSFSIVWGGPARPVVGDTTATARLTSVDGRRALNIPPGSWAYPDVQFGLRVGDGAELGGAGDIPAGQDFDGDGTADVAVFNDRTGLWRISNRAAGSSTSWTSTGQSAHARAEIMTATARPIRRSRAPPALAHRQSSAAMAPQ